MSTALTVRLSRPADVPKALSIVFAGISVSMVLAAPLGSLLEKWLGWRGVFSLAAAVGGICTLWQCVAFPRLAAPENRSSFRGVVALLRRQGIGMAMLAMTFVFAGQIAFFTFVRPLYEIRNGFGVSGVSFVLVVLGVANFMGTSVSSYLLRSHLRAVLVAAPVVMAIAGITAFVAVDSVPFAIGAIAIWGASMGCIPVSWSTWITRQLGDDVENGGGLQISLIQIANITGPAVGGIAYDAVGIVGPVAVSVMLSGSGAVLAFIAVKTLKESHSTACPQVFADR